MIARRRLTGLLLLLMVAAACGDGPSATSLPPAATTSIVPPTSAATTTTPPTVDATQVPSTLAELNAMLYAIATAPGGAAAEQAAATLYETLAEAGRVPFVDQGHAVFLHYRDGSALEVRGDFTGWERGEPLVMEEVGETWLWRGVAALPNHGRTEYKLVVDGEWILDPANPNTQMGGYGPNSVLAMPGYRTSDFSDPPAGPRGTFEEARVISSAAMGYDIAYRVYLPHGYAALDDLPVLYVTDGSDFWNPEMGAMTEVLDHLIATGAIEPVMAVFMDAWDPDRTVNRREVEFLERPEDYARFLTGELIPLIDAGYATDPRPEGRVIVGTSYGAVGAVYFSLLPPESFMNLALYSPAFGAFDPAAHSDPVRAETALRMGEVLEAATDCGDEDCPVAGVRIFMSYGIPAWDVGDLAPVSAGWELFGIEAEVLNPPEGHNWGHWAAVTDEMLEFFFGTR